MDVVIETTHTPLPMNIPNTPLANLHCIEKRDFMEMYALTPPAPRTPPPMQRRRESLSHDKIAYVQLIQALVNKNMEQLNTFATVTLEVCSPEGHDTTNVAGKYFRMIAPYTPNKMFFQKQEECTLHEQAPGKLEDGELIPHDCFVPSADDSIERYAFRNGISFSSRMRVTSESVLNLVA